ncbi:hypothetical protein MNV49_003472 [Pseudohyphozyma bogoriensis]|nr:hypothetical protein MNV49_003472 [Pseudohyphozyma bogoriensis]
MLSPSQQLQQAKYVQILRYLEDSRVPKHQTFTLRHLLCASKVSTFESSLNDTIPLNAFIKLAETPKCLSRTQSKARENETWMAWREWCSENGHPAPATAFRTIVLFHFEASRITPALRKAMDEWSPLDSGARGVAPDSVGEALYSHPTVPIEDEAPRKPTDEPSSSTPVLSLSQMIKPREST